MRIALISDVHANATALEAVLSHAHSETIDAVWNMGDLVGYGPDPDEVVAILQSAGARSVLGNHDAAAIGVIDVKRFNPLAAAAAEWTASAITPGTAHYLRGLPRIDQDDDATLVHGSLRDPLWEYVETMDIARAHFALQDTWLSAIGHTHLPVILYCDERGAIRPRTPAEGEPVSLDQPGRWCLNPGGVGQPRDGDPRASYALLDLAHHVVTYFRIPYDIAATQARMRARGLAEPHIARLALGR